MWSENWGEMIWGGGSSVMQIPFGAWGLLPLGILFGVSAVYTLRGRHTRLLPFLVLTFVPVVSVIAANVPHLFQNGTTADANQVNENFDALLSTVMALEDRIASLESALEVSNNGDVTLSGNNVTVKAAVSTLVQGSTTEIDGSQTLDLDSSGITNLTGAILNLNGGGLPNARVSDPVQVTCNVPPGGGLVSCTGTIVGVGNATTLN
ncbi:MAG: hypothetical protein AAF387_06855 [Pseudomonadota bacterium]